MKKHNRKRPREKDKGLRHQGSVTRQDTSRIHLLLKRHNFHSVFPLFSVRWQAKSSSRPLVATTATITARTSTVNTRHERCRCRRRCIWIEGRLSHALETAVLGPIELSRVGVTSNQADPLVVHQLPQVNPAVEYLVSPRGGRIHHNVNTWVCCVRGGGSNTSRQ